MHWFKRKAKVLKSIIVAIPLLFLLVYPQQANCDFHIGHVEKLLTTNYKSKITSRYKPFTNDFTTKANTSNCAEISQWHPPSLGSSADIFVVDNFAYLAGSHFYIIDITNLHSPKLQGECDSSGLVFISGNYTYLGAGTNLTIVDISDHTNPRAVGNYWEGYNGRVEDIFVEGNHAYIAYGYYGLIILDVSNPVNITKIAQYKDIAGNGGEGRAVSIVGNNAYLIDRQGLKIIDISNLSNITKIGELTGMFAYEIYVEGNYAYLPCSDEGVRIIDISNQTNPVEVGQYYDGSGNAYDIFVEGNYAYVADYSDGLEIIDISNPENPIEIGQYNDDLGVTWGVFAANSIAFLADGGDGLEIIGSDSDNDALADYSEAVFGTDQNNPDSDGDGLLDGEEVKEYGTDPLKGDSDGDGLLDGEEVKEYRTDPLKGDSDEDDFSDSEELAAGTDPLNNKSNPRARRIRLSTGVISGLLLVFVITTMFILKQYLEHKMVETIAHFEPLLPNQTYNWLRDELGISPKEFIKRHQSIEQTAKILLQFHREKGYLLVEDRETFLTIFNSIETDPATILLTLKILSNRYSINLRGMTTTTLAKLDKATARAIAVLGSKHAKSSIKEERNNGNIDKDNYSATNSKANHFSLTSLILDANCSLIEAKIILEIITICEENPQTVSFPTNDDSWPCLNIDHLGCNLLKARWRRQERGLPEFTLMETAYELGLGILSSVLFLRELDLILSKQWQQQSPLLIEGASTFFTHTVALSPTDLEQPSVQQHKILVKSYATALFDLWNKEQLVSLQDPGEVAEKLNLESLQMTFEVIILFIQQMLIDNPKAVAEAITTTRLDKFPIRKIPTNQQLQKGLETSTPSQLNLSIELSHLLQVFEQWMMNDQRSER